MAVRGAAGPDRGRGVHPLRAVRAGVSARGDRGQRGNWAGRWRSPREGGGVLILSAEAAAHFYPATPEQVVNACYAAGFRMVNRGVIGDELVAAEYLKLWRDEALGHPDPLAPIRWWWTRCARDYPELVPYLAPVTIPAVAEARYLRALHGRAAARSSTPGVCPPAGRPELDAAITFGDLEQLLRLRGVSAARAADFFQRVPEERRRHLSAAGGLPLAMLEEAPYASRRFRKIRGLEAAAGARPGGGGGPARPGVRGHPVARGVRWTIRSRGRRKSCYWRRTLVASAEPPRSRCPVVDRAVVASVRRHLRDRAPAGAVRSDARCEAMLDADRARAERAAVGLPGLRLRDLRRLRRRRRRWAGRRCASARPTRSGGRRRRSGTAAVDALTGLATYRVLRDRLSHEIERSKRSGEGFAVLFLDLDRFKQVNDRYGHEAGNEVLRAVADEIRNAVRASDLAARYGGDEFVVILTRTDLHGRGRVAEALRAGIEGVGRRLGYPPGLVTVSIGVAEFDPAAPAEGDLLVAADRALYQAKAAGRNRGRLSAARRRHWKRHDT